MKFIGLIKHQLRGVDLCQIKGLPALEFFLPILQQAKPTSTWLHGYLEFISLPSPHVDPCPDIFILVAVSYLVVFVLREVKLTRQLPTAFLLYVRHLVVT